MTDYYDANRRNWNERAGIHARSQMYNRRAYVDDPQHLSSIVRFDQRYLGDLTGLTAVHLQCHIGNDTLSLARLGATVTDLDLSDASIAATRELFANTGTAGRFEIAQVYDAVDVLGERYDLVYTGVGALNWADVVARLLRPRRQAVPTRRPSDAVGARRRADRRPAPAPTSGTTASARSSPLCSSTGSC